MSALLLPPIWLIIGMDGGKEKVNLRQSKQKVGVKWWLMGHSGRQLGFWGWWGKSNYFRAL
jgi:hypothetical protein